MDLNPCRAVHEKLPKSAANELKAVWQGAKTAAIKHSASANPDRIKALQESIPYHPWTRGLLPMMKKQGPSPNHGHGQNGAVIDDPDIISATEEIAKRWNTPRGTLKAESKVGARLKHKTAEEAPESRL